MTRFIESKKKCHDSFNAGNRKFGRRKDEVWIHYLEDSCQQKLHRCKFCNKEFSSPANTALRGHLSNERYARENKTTLCDSQSQEVLALKSKYSNEFKSKRSKKRRNCVLECDSSQKQRLFKEETRIFFRLVDLPESDSNIALFNACISNIIAIHSNNVEIASSQESSINNRDDYCISSDTELDDESGFESSISSGTHELPRRFAASPCSIQQNITHASPINDFDMTDDDLDEMLKVLDSFEYI